MSGELTRPSRLVESTERAGTDQPDSSSHPSLQAFEREIGADCYRDLLDQFPDIFRGLDNPRLSLTLDRVFPEERMRLSELAEMAVRHRFEAAGSEWIDLGSVIDWSRDIRSGRTWSMKDSRLFRSAIDYDTADPRFLWRISRGGHFLPMALEYILVGGDTYPLEFASQVVSWIEHNEYERGINWTNATETALRAINWLVAYRLFSRRWEFREDFARLLAVELYKAGKHIHANADFVGMGFNNVAYLTQQVALLFLGELFKGTVQGSEWRNIAMIELERECSSQVDADGCCNESSFAYQGLMTEALLYASLLSERSGSAFPSDVLVALKKMILVLEQFTQGDGKVVPFGDVDDLRLIRPLGRAPRDFRDVISIGRRALGLVTADSPALTPEEHLVCDVGDGGARRTEGNVALGSVCYRQSGLCQARSRLLTFNFLANPVGNGGQSTHKHNDILSFTLEYRGQRVFTNPGTYSHLSGEGWRNLFRSTASHSTIMVDGQEQNRLLSQLPTHLRNDSRPRITLWKTDSDSDLVVAESDSYARLDDPVIHRRAAFLDKHHEVLLIRDELFGKEIHEIVANFILEPIEITPERSGCLRLITGQAGEGLLFALLEPEGNFKVSTTWISPAYGVKEAGLKLSMRKVTRLPLTSLYAILPLRDLEPDQLHSMVDRTRARIGW